MSYILDALNKSEKDRVRKRTPGVDALQNDTERQTTLSLRSVALIILGIAIINAAGLYLFFQDDETEPAIIEVTPSLKVEPLIVDTPTPEPATPVPRTPSQPPEIEITAHIFAAEPDLRMVKIDGVNRQAGDYLTDNHQLIEITETGVVLEFEGRRYNLDVVEDWQVR